MSTRRRTLLYLGFAVTGLVLGLVLVALRDKTCFVQDICVVNPSSTGPNCLPQTPDCGTFVRDNILIVASVTLAVPAAAFFMWSTHMWSTRAAHR